MSQGNNAEVTSNFSKPPIRVLLLVVCGLLLCGSCFAADTRANIPDWVRQAAAQPIPKYPAETNAVVLLREETDTITGPDEHIEHLRRVVKILRPDGRHLADLNIYIGGGEKLLDIHGWSMDAGGHEYELKPKDFVDRSRFDFELYSDIMYKQAMAPGAGPGAVVAFEYQVKRRDYFNELQWDIQRHYPVLRSSLNVQLPAGWELKENWSATTPVKPAADGPNGWVWTKQDLPGIDEEPDRPVDDALAARLTLEIYTPERKLGTNWAAISTWASGLFRTQRSVTPEMSAKVQALVADKPDFEAKVRAITEFVQHEVRYVEISFGIGGYLPHSAPDVFHARYGDCKDKANLLSALLGQVGINSEMVLIQTYRGVVRPETPGLYFNHAILAIELPANVPGDRYPGLITSTKTGKRYVFFDPTDEWMPFGQVRAELQDSYALMVTDSGGELIHVPIAAPASSEVVRSARLKLSPDGAITGAVTEKLTGDFAETLRMRAEHSNQTQQLQHYENQVADSVRNATLQDLTFDGLKELSLPVDVHYNLSADRYAQITGPLLIVRPRVLGNNTIGLDRKPRKYPLVLGGTALETDDFELELPPGYVVDDKPDPVSVDTPFASYKSHIEVNGSKLHYTREYVMKSLEIPADKIEDLRAFETKVAADENAAVVLKKIGTASGQ